MKLIKILFFISVAVDVKCNELFTFPPKFHAPNTGVMVSSDSSIYLPPESHTTAPYYPMKNFNNMPFPYLPHTGTKASMIMPTPYPIIVSSTLLPMHDNVDDDNDDEKQPTQFQIQKNNRTQRDRLENMERRDLRPKSMNYQPIDRIDMKPSFGFFNNNPSTPPTPPVQKATARSMIISPEQQRSDALEQFRAAATYQGPHYLPAPNAPGVFISSTTETAVPILRLSNEMDLDGSFSYEALGADQTHYEQHSRMENTGTDKEEQVVEGSYSYVGDNGQTYTVHYVADSNGFRASGDHLPVPPPVPEIIQRAVQFNLAEEAKRPPNQKSWNEEKENEASESERYQRFVMPPTIRPLFTGKTPESFSFGFAQGAHNPPNLLAVASTPNPTRTNSEFPQNQVKSNINNVNNAGPISPQITFLASQGAHLPSGNTQPSMMARVFTTDRSTLPQLVNYEAASKEDTEQHENNKGLWRWQYGLNANVNNQTPEKKSISRSSGIGDDVMINFGDMTSDQYSKMLKSQILPSGSNQDNQMPHTNDMMKVYKEPNHKTKVHDAMRPEVKLTVVTTAASSTEAPDWKNSYDAYDNNNSYQPTENTNQRQKEEQSFSFKSKLITQDNFVPQSQMITQSYDYDDIYYEPKRISRSSSTLAPGILPYVSQHNMNNYDYGTQNSLWSNQNQIENIQKIWSTESPAISTPAHRIQFNDFIVNENKNDFKPILPSHETENQEQYSSTTENIAEDIFESNMFLKNLFKNNVKEQNTVSTPKEEKQIYQTNKQIEHKPDKTPKFIQLQTKPYNDVKTATKKQYDLADIMTFISAKNHFESAKVKPKSKHGANNYNQRSEFRFIPVQEDPMISEGNDDEDENTNMDQKDRNHRTSYYHPEELRGIIKNYKVLQRNNSAFKSRQDAERLKTELSPPPVKILGTNLPPLGRAGPSVKSYLPPIYV